MRSSKSPRATPRKRPIALLRSLLTTAAVSVGACSGPSEPSGYQTLPPDKAMLEVLQAKQALMRQRGLNVIWFGHSLLNVRGGVPIHIPELAGVLRQSAIDAGKATGPAGISRTHYEGPNHLGYWFEGAGKAQDKLRTEDPGWDFVVGVGFMHLVSEGRVLAWGYNPLRGLGGDSFKTYAAYTGSKYKAIRAVREYGRGAVWVNYVAPRLSDHPEEQPFVDERFECIRETAATAGITIVNVPVGRAFRLAEARMQEKPELQTALQREDRLHLTKAGEYLAANVFLAELYGIDPVGLPVPATHAKAISDAPDKAPQVATLLQEAARDTVAAYLRGERAPCRPEAKLAEDAAGLELLRAP